MPRLVVNNCWPVPLASPPAFGLLTQISARTVSSEIHNTCTRGQKFRLGYVGRESDGLSIGRARIWLAEPDATGRIIP